MASGWLVIGRTAFTVLLRTCWAPDLLGAHELLAAARCRSLQIRRLAFKMIQFEATISDQVSLQKTLQPIDATRCDTRMRPNVPSSNDGGRAVGVLGRGGMH